MCEFNEYGDVTVHTGIEYTCPECGEELCTDCNPLNQPGLWNSVSWCWYGSIWCCICGANIEEALRTA